MNCLLSLFSGFCTSFCSLHRRELEVLVNSGLLCLVFLNLLSSLRCILAVSLTRSQFTKNISKLMKLRLIFIHVPYSMSHIATILCHQTKICNSKYTTNSNLAIPMSSRRKLRSGPCLVQSSREPCQNDTVDSPHFRAIPHRNLLVLFLWWLVLWVWGNVLPYLVKDSKALMFLQKTLDPFHQIPQYTKQDIMQNIPSHEERRCDDLKSP